MRNQQWQFAKTIDLPFGRDYGPARNVVKGKGKRKATGPGTDSKATVRPKALGTRPSDRTRPSHSRTVKEHFPKFHESRGKPMAEKAEKIEIIPLSQIEADWSWNSRSKGILAHDSGGMETENVDFKGIVESIKANRKAGGPAWTGQLDPVEVRPNPNPKNVAKKPYTLVKGFQRYEALALIADEEKDKEAGIRAVIHELTEIEARRHNSVENIARNNLTVADTAVAIARMADGGASDVAIASEIGLTQGYVSKMHRIMAIKGAGILKHWRESASPLNYKDMLRVLDAPPDQQRAKYDELCAAAMPKEKVKGNWIKACMVKAEKAGRLLGELQKTEILTIATDPDFSVAVRLMCHPKGDATNSQLNKLATAMRTSYVAEMQRQEEAAEDGKEETEGKGNGKAAETAA
jgi:ParB/RepB/Spo0J family partition protein